MSGSIDGIAPSFLHFDTLPRPVRNQLDRIVYIWESRLGEALVGVYLHGSVALGQFRERGSDLDILIVVNRRLKRGERLSFAEAMIDADGNPSPVEISALRRYDLSQWRHPAECQFHYSGAWTARYLEVLALESDRADPEGGASLRDRERGPLSAAYNLLENGFLDPDIACHARLTRESGIVLSGAPIAGVFLEVPEADFWDSLTYDLYDIRFDAGAPMPSAQGLLTLTRVLSYRRLRRILSKYAAAVWSLRELPERYRPVVEWAARTVFSRDPSNPPPAEGIEACFLYLKRMIRA